MEGEILTKLALLVCSPATDAAWYVEASFNSGCEESEPGLFLAAKPTVIASFE